MAARDEIIAYADELLDLDSFKDFGPQGLQVVGADDVSRVICAVSSSLELFRRAADAGAQLVIVHHGVLWENESRVIDRRVRRRLETLFGADINLAGYHLALDAHPELGNNALLARELGVEVDGPFMELGVGGRTAQRLEDLLARIRARINPDALAFAHGSGEVDRVAIVSGGAARYLTDAAAQGYDVYITGEPAEPSQALARELDITFVAAGHHATEKLGVQALTEKLANRFNLEWEFIDLPNPV
jgi:dinuclear metal center YbgI/SA1388 family protein